MHYLLSVSGVIILSLVVCTKVFSQEQVPDYDKEQVFLVLLEKAKRVVKLAADDFIVKAVELQNEEQLTLEEIKRRDIEWVRSKTSPLKILFQESEMGIFLKSSVLRNRAIYSEVFLTDNQGANVGAYPPTSDYWQGDEVKFNVAFNQGQGQLLIMPIVFDESSNTYASQIAVPVNNKKGITIGVLFVGIKFSYTQLK